MKTDAERKVRQRLGYLTLPIEVHLKSFLNTLVAEGFLTDDEREDRDAIRNAASRFIDRHCSVGRILRDSKSNPATPHTAKRPKGKRRDCTKHGPVRQYTPEQIAAYEKANGASLRAPKYGPWIDDKKKRLADKLTEQGVCISFGGYYPGQSHGHVDFGSLGALPPDWSERGRSGDRDGRNRSRIEGRFKSDGKEFRVGRIEQLSEARAKHLEKPYAEKLKVEGL